ncbi:MAG: hypothetical protein ACTSVI_05040, partial [Promethearchaeota archaeon]
IERVKNFLENDPLGTLYAPFFEEMQLDFTYYSKPLTPEFMNGNIFIWEKNPFQYHPPTSNPRYEFAGISFPIVYWLGRAFEFFPSGGMRDE